MINIITVNLVSGFLEFTLFGIFIILSFASLILLIRRHRTASAADRNPLSSDSSTPSSVRKVRRWALEGWRLRKSPLVIANVLLMFTVSIHFVFSAQRLVAAVIRHDGGAPTIAFLIDLRERTQVARLVLLVIAMFIGDVVITYRVWLVWGQLLSITAFPILTVIGVIVAGSGMIHQFTVSTSDVGVFTAAVSPWITATCVMTVCTNVYGTVVIAWRVWDSNRVLRRTGILEGGRNILEGMAIFIESAALWTSWVILYLVWYLIGSPLEAIGSGTAPVMIGITFTLITVRVGLGWGQESKPASSSMRWAMPSGSFGIVRGQKRGLRPQAISLSVTRTVEHDWDNSGGVDRDRDGESSFAVAVDAKKTSSEGSPHHSDGKIGAHV